jgi:hypothetical protein
MMINEQTNNQVVENGIIYKDQSILSLVAPDHLERLIQVCSEDGMAVLEYRDSGLVIIAEKQGEDFVIWQLTKRQERA